MGKPRAEMLVRVKEETKGKSYHYESRVYDILNVPVPTRSNLLSVSKAADGIAISTLFLVVNPENRFVWADSGSCEPIEND